MVDNMLQPDMFKKTDKLSHFISYIKTCDSPKNFRTLYLKKNVPN